MSCPPTISSRWASRRSGRIPCYPRLRLELRTTLSWKEDVELALDRLLGAVQKEPALRPL